MQKGCHTPFCLFIGALLLFGRRSAHFLSIAVLFQTRGPLLEFSFYISPLDIPSVTASLSLQQEVTSSSSSHSSPSLLFAVNFRSCAGRAASGIRLTRAPSRAEQGAEVMGLKVKHHTAAGRHRSVCQSRLSSSSFPLRCAAACTSLRACESQQRRATQLSRGWRAAERGRYQETREAPAKFYANGQITACTLTSTASVWLGANSFSRLRAVFFIFFYLYFSDAPTDL